MTLLSRRNLLKGLGAGAVGISIGSLPSLQRWSMNIARAQAEQNSISATAFLRFPLGDLEITVIQDTRFEFPPSTFAANATSDELTAFLEENALPTSGTLNATVNNTLIKSGDTYTLLDTGTGSQLLPTLELVGITADQITNVVHSHFHPDHIGGSLRDGAATYPNAMYYLPQLEWDFLQNAGLAAVADAKAAMETLEVAGQLSFYESDAEIVPGVQAVASLGHTPGHHSLLIASGGAQLLNIVDAALHPQISLLRTDWYPGFDSIPEQAVESRRALLERITSEKLQILGYHFAFPGIGYVDTEGEGYRFVAAI